MKMNKILISSLITATAAAAAIGGWMLMNQNRGSEIPDFTGSTKAEVEQWAEENRISSERMTFLARYDENAENGIVIDQDPDGGGKLEEDDKLQVTLSKGADPNVEFTMPDFAGKTEKEIIKWFDDHKFQSVAYTYEYTEDSRKEGEFIASDPVAGSKLKRSARVRITLVTHVHQEVTVPDLSSYSLNNIRAWADENRITLQVEYEENGSVPDGTILRVSETAGTILHTGDSISVTVSVMSYPETSAAESTPAAQSQEETAAAAPASAPASASPPAAETTTPETAPATPHVPDPEPQPEPAPEPQPEPQPEPIPEPEPEPEPEPQAVCPASVPMIFSEASQAESYMSASYPGCAVSFSYLNDRTTNPNNYLGVAAAYPLSETQWHFEMYVRWN